MDSFSLGKSVGVLTGIIVGLIICVILFKFMNKDKKIMTKYDERQKAVRGKGYMYGFWGSMGAAAIVMCLDVGGISFANRFSTDFFIIFVGILVQVSYCIWNDGYFGVNNDKKRLYIISIAAAICNLLAVIGNIKGGTFIVDGVLSDSATNLMCFILFIVIGIELMIKDSVDKRSETVEESED